jgi:hypothetical protein
MTSTAQARKIALSMPRAEEHPHHGHPSFRVKNKIFATLYGARAVVKLSIADQTALVQMAPRAFSLNAWSHQGWTNVELKRVSVARFRSLVESAWRRRRSG